MSDVRERLLDAAERVFAEQGVANASVRDITGAAGANVASINYYFGSREALLTAVIHRRQEPLHAERLRRLAAAPPEVEAILAALVEPSVRLCFDHPHFARLASQLRAEADRSLWREYREHGAAFRERFREAMAAALPHLPAAELETRLHFVHGAIQHVWAHCPLPADESPERLLARFLAFFTAGLQAPTADFAAGSQDPTPSQTQPGAQ